jgi:hypothetical protein
MGMAARRVQQRIDRELNKSSKNSLRKQSRATLSRTDRPR